MSVEQIIRTAAQYNTILLAAFIALPFLVLLLWLFHGRFGAALSPWKYVYSVLVYASCIPGMFALVFTLYTAFFLRGNLMTVNAVVYFLPVISMFVTLVLIRKRITFDQIPGFNKIQGLMMLLAATFITAIVLDRLRIILFFRGSFAGFLLVCAVIFIVFKFGTRLIFGRFRSR